MRYNKQTIHPSNINEPPSQAHLLVHAVRDGGGSRLVDNPHDDQASDGTGVLGKGGVSGSKSKSQSKSSKSSKSSKKSKKSKSNKSKVRQEKEENSKKDK